LATLPAGYKGRGAAGNPAGRFEQLARERVPDAGGIDKPPVTVVETRSARTIIARNDSPDIPFSQSINPYQGCEHGCIYCYARPSHAYLGLSPGLEFETRLFAKVNAAELLREELSRPGYRCDQIAIGSNTDPYQPVERDLRITRGLLEVLREFRHPVGIVTKSALIERDIDLLTPMAAEGLAEVYVSVTTLDPDVARQLEPRAAAPFRRVETLRRLAEAGIPCGVLAAPIIPFLNDKDIERILEQAAGAGATRAGYQLLRLPHEVKDLFQDWLERRYPLKAAHVMARVRDLRGGKANDPRFGSRMTGEGRYAELVAQRFEVACRRLGLNGSSRGGLDRGKFRVPGPEQMRLL
jgi:DNA repair photolyase